jgi:hypothetical protein
MSIHPTTGVISGTVAVGASSQGWFYPTITVSNGTYATTQWFRWDISSPVTVSGMGYQWNTVGDSVSLQVAGSGSGTLTYAASGLPTGLSLNTGTGLITGTVSSSTSSVGKFTTTITVSNGSYSAVESLNWFVEAAGSLTLSTPSNQTDDEGDSVSLALSASGSGTIKYFALGLPGGLVLNPSTGGISGTVSVNTTQTKPYTVTVVATNGTDSAWQTFTWTVNAPLSFSPVTDRSNDEGDTVSLTPNVTYTGSGTLRYGAVGLPAGLSEVDPKNWTSD